MTNKNRKFLNLHKKYLGNYQVEGEPDYLPITRKCNIFFLRPHKWRLCDGDGYKDKVQCYHCGKTKWEDAGV